MENTVELIKKEIEKVKNDPLFLGTMKDHFIIESISSGKDNMPFTEEDYMHLLHSISSHLNPMPKKDKLDFTILCTSQIYDLINGKISSTDEVLQALYMTMFQKYNDRKNKDTHYSLTDDFVERVSHPQKIVSSEQYIGNIYMTPDKYQELMKKWEELSSSDRKGEFQRFYIEYVLKSIRNRMMHGDFENVRDDQGRKIVKIHSSNDTIQTGKTHNVFKAKFQFDCILEFYRAISDQIRNNNASEPLIDFEQVLLDKNTNSGIFKDEDKLMEVLLPLYVNSFLTYNFNKSETELAALSQELKSKSPTSKKAKFLDLFHEEGSTDSFAYKVAEYNGQKYTPEEIVRHLRNAIVHHSFTCTSGEAIIRDRNSYDTSGKLSAEFRIPYSLFKELIERQNSLIRTTPSGQDAGRSADSQEDPER